ncbi:MAG: SLATT domain-containing protein [Caldilineaceae bacterium]|nr:SLATT domain-containing protein [Caldilineaceae bacterium]
MPKKNWTDELEQLLVTWAEKASGYAWLHQKSAILFKKKNLCISIPSCIFGYLSGITLLLSNDVFNNCSDISYRASLRGVLGVTAILSGVLSNFQEMFTFKEEAEKHRIAALRFLSFFREISCELSLDPKIRSASMDYITLKRFEFDKILEQSPDIPEEIIKEFNNNFRTVSIHKPDPVIGLQTILPFGKKIKDELERKLSIKDKILLLRSFNGWRKITNFKKYTRKNSDEFLIEVTNSRNSSLELIDIENNEISKKRSSSFLLSGVLSEQKRFVQNQNIKIKQNPLNESEENLSTPNTSEESK